MSYDPNLQWQQYHHYGTGAAPTFTDGVMRIESPDTTTNRAMYALLQVKGGDKIRFETMARAVSGQGRIYMNLASLPGTLAAEILIAGKSDFEQHSLEYVVPFIYSQVDLYIGTGATITDVGIIEAYAPNLLVNGRAVMAVPETENCIYGTPDLSYIRAAGVDALAVQNAGSGVRKNAVYPASLVGSPFFPFATLDPHFRLVGDGNNPATLGIACFSNAAANGPTVRMLKSRSANAGAFSATQSGDILSAQDFYGDIGSAYGRACRWEVYQDAAITGGFVPGRWQLRVTTASAIDVISLVVDSARAVRAGSDNAQPLGTASIRWSTVYAGTGTINTSDEREKQDITEIPGDVLDAWSAVQYQQFRFKDAAEEKGPNARLHIGVIAQRVKEAFESFGIDPFEYGILCYDEWDELPEEYHAEPEQIDDDGNVVVQAKRVIDQHYRSAGNRYGVRYEEALALEAALMRRTTAKLEARIKSLESK